jgi:hypothetical protein
MLDSIVLNFQSAPKTTERALEMVSRSLSYRDYQNFHFKHEKNFFNFAGKSRFSCDVEKNILSATWNWSTALSQQRLATIVIQDFLRELYFYTSDPRHAAALLSLNSLSGEARW